MDKSILIFWFFFQFFFIKIVSLGISVVNEAFIISNMSFPVEFTGDCFTFRGEFAIFRIVLFKKCAINFQLGLPQGPPSTNTQRASEILPLLSEILTRLTHPISFRDFINLITTLMNRNITKTTKYYLVLIKVIWGVADITDHIIMIQLLLINLRLEDAVFAYVFFFLFFEFILNGHNEPFLNGKEGFEIVKKIS